MAMRGTLSLKVDLQSLQVLGESLTTGIDLSYPTSVTRHVAAYMHIEAHPVACCQYPSREKNTTTSPRMKYAVKASLSVLSPAMSRKMRVHLLQWLQMRRQHCARPCLSFDLDCSRSECPSPLRPLAIYLLACTLLRPI